MKKLSELDNIKAHLSDIDNKFASFYNNGNTPISVPNRS